MVYDVGKKRMEKEKKTQTMEEQCSACPDRTKHREEGEYKSLITRLNRIEGQVRGIKKMVEEDRYCEFF